MSESNIVVQGDLRNNYSKMSNKLLGDYRLSTTARVLYGTLINLSFKGKYITQEFLTKVMLDKQGKPSSEKTINRLINELKKTGWLTVTTQKVFDRERGKCQTLAKYIVHVENAAAPMTYSEQQRLMAEEQIRIAEMDGLQPCLDDSFDNLESELKALGVESSKHDSRLIVDAIAEAKKLSKKSQQRLHYWADAFLEKVGRPITEQELEHIAERLLADSEADFSRAIENSKLAEGANR